MDLYWGLFGLGAVVAFSLEWANHARKGGSGNTSPEFSAFRANYLIVYSMMMGERGPVGRPGVPPPAAAARSPQPPPPNKPAPPPPTRATARDGLQGPHVYRLYDFYGFDMGQIGKLFIAGFGSSMVFGTVVGALADKQCVGRWGGACRCAAGRACSRRGPRAPLGAPACRARPPLSKTAAPGRPTTAQLPPALASTRPPPHPAPPAPRSTQRPQARGADLLHHLHPGLPDQARQQLLGAGGRPRAVRHRHLAALLRL